MPRVDALDHFVKTLTPLQREFFMKAVVSSKWNSIEPSDNRYVDWLREESTHAMRPTWTQMRDYRRALEELRSRNPKTVAAFKQARDDCSDLHLNIIRNHVSFEEWSECNNKFRERRFEALACVQYVTETWTLVSSRSYDLGFCNQAATMMMLYFRDRLVRLEEKHEKAMKAVIDRVSHQVAKKACLNVVEHTRSKRR